MYQKIVFLSETDSSKSRKNRKNYIGSSTLRNGRKEQIRLHNSATSGLAPTRVKTLPTEAHFITLLTKEITMQGQPLEIVRLSGHP